MPTLDVTIAGRRHQVQCDDGQEGRLRRLAAFVDTRASEIARRNPALGEARVLVLAGIMMADELFDMSEELNQQRAQGAQQADLETQEATKVLERVADRLDRLADDLARA